jgi:hypothetical protein
MHGEWNQPSVPIVPGRSRPKSAQAGESGGDDKHKRYPKDQREMGGYRRVAGEQLESSWRAAGEQEEGRMWSIDVVSVRKSRTGAKIVVAS